MIDIKNKKIKICHVATVDITARFIFLNFLKFLKEENYDVFLACSFSKWEQFFVNQGFFVKNIKITRCITPISDLISFIKLFLYFKKEKFDIVHTHTPKAGFLGRVAARLAGVPVVIHSSYGFYLGAKVSSSKKVITIIAEKIASYFCDLFFSQNEEDIKFAIKYNIVSANKIKLLTYGIDVNRFNPEKFNEKFICDEKKKNNINGKIVIGMVGRFVKEKGYLDLFDAFKIVKNKIPNAVLLLVAPQDKEKDDALTSSILKEYDIEKDVVLLGYNNEIADIERVYSLMDMFVLPSYREGFSMSLLEAQAMKKPVVATNIRGCREAVENEKTGILVPLGNIDNLALAIIYFLSNPKKSVEVGEIGRDRVLAQFDERRTFSKLKADYVSFLKKKIKI